MTTQLHLAYGIVADRTREAEAQVLLRTVERARRERRRSRRVSRRG